MPILAWWAGLTVIGWVAYLLLQSYFSGFSDRGYAVSKAIGLVLLTYAAWLLASLHIVPFGALGVTGILIVAGVVGLILAWRRAPKISDYINKLIVGEELLFACCIFIWSFVRSFNPRAEGVEKLMDVAILNGLLRSHWLPPQDVWYGGSTINYYYFGHLMVATLAKLTHVSVEYASNFGLIGVFALVITITFSLVMTLTKSKLAGGVAAFLLALSANLDPAINALKQTKDYIFFSATRLDKYTINEFPLYSFVVADMHAHMLGLTVVMGLIGVLYALFAESKKMPWPLLVVLIVALGATGPTNSFDLAVYGALTGAVMLFRQLYYMEYSWRSAGKAVLMTLGIGVAALVAYAPFYLNFTVPVGGIGVDLFKTPLFFILNNFGIMLFIAAPLFWLIPTIWQRLTSHKGEQIAIEYVFGVALLLFAIVVILAPEVVYLKDIYAFQNPPYARANTIFKVYYQAWVLLAIAAGVGIGYVKAFKATTQNDRLWTNAYVIGVGVLLGMSLVGTWSGFKTIHNTKPSTINGYTYLKSEMPGQLALINWINSNISGQPTLLEAAGESYTQRSRVSAYTGLIVPIGWASHEWGWRYSASQWPVIAGRMGEVQTMYTTSDKSELESLVKKWGIDYIVVSPVEREQYGAEAGAAISSTYGPPIWSQGEYALYKVSP